MIGKLLGHSRTESTARYTHLARSAVHKAAERVADSLAKDILQDARRRSVRGRAGAAVGHAGLHSRTIGPRVEPQRRRRTRGVAYLKNASGRWREASTRCDGVAIAQSRKTQ